MKKFLITGICLSLCLICSGCGLEDAFNKYIVKKNGETAEIPSDKPRVYMDEFTGLFTDFDGSRITLISEEGSQVFDVSQASVECAKGLISGESVSVIYEGRLSSDDTSTVKVLKVVDDFHGNSKRKEEVIEGTLENLTPNTITLKNRDGNSLTYPVTGTLLYFHNGIKKDMPVSLHSYGNTANLRYVKIKSASDTEPLKEELPESEKQFHGTIRDIRLNTLEILPDGGDTPLNIDLSSLPCLLKGGAAPGSPVNILYEGEFQTNTLDGISILAVKSEIPKSRGRIASSVTGTIKGSTASTISIETTDGAFLTCQYTGAVNASTGGLLTGSSVRIIFDPEASRNTNIYSCIRIEDA